MKPTYEELAAQNDCLQNLCYQLCTAVSDMDDCEDNSEEMESAIDQLFQITRRAYGVVHGTPQQALAEIRAEAVADFAKALSNTVQIPNGPMTRVDYYKAAIRHAIQFASQYAEQIRQGGVK